MKWILFGLGLLVLLAYQLGALSVKASLAVTALKLCFIVFLVIACYVLLTRAWRRIRDRQ